MTESVKSKVLCSTGALIGRPNGRDYHLLKEFVPQLECDGLEFMLYSDWYPVIDELIADLKSYHIDIPVMHCQKSVGESLAGMETVKDGEYYRDCVFSEEEDREVFADGLRRFESNLRVAEAIGARYMVMHLWNGVVSDKNIDKNFERFGLLKKLSEQYGVDLLVENVICNQKDPMTHLLSLHSMYPDAHFIYDTKMAEFHGQNNLAFEGDFGRLFEGGFIRHLHINDYSGGYMDWGNLKVLPIGAGHVDFDSFMSGLAACGYSGSYTLEATGFGKDGHVDFDMLNTNFAAMRKLIEHYMT